MSEEQLTKLAGRPEWYPEMDNLIDLCMQDLLLVHDRGEALRIVRDVFTGLTQADIRGLISVGDEHEWAAVALRANARGLQGEGR